MRKLLMLLGLLAAFLFTSTEASAGLNDGRIKKYATDAARTADTKAPVGTIGHAADTNDFKWVSTTAGTWVAISTGTTFTGANSGTIDNAVNYKWSLNEVNSAAGAEDLDFDFTTANQVTVSSNTGVATLVTLLDLSLGGGAAVLTFTDSASSIVTPANDTTALLIGPAAQPGLITIDSGTATETVQINGTTTVMAFDVATGTANFAEPATFASGAGAVTLTNSAASILTIDADTSALDIGSAGLTTALRYSSADDLEAFTFNAGVLHDSQIYNTGAHLTLDKSDCGSTVFTGATMDGFTYTLPATIAGCEITFMYVGADNGLLLDVSPNASDAIHGSCTLAASVLEFSGTDDADIGLTKATSNTGDTITIIGDGTEGWYVKACAGIWANN